MAYVHRLITTDENMIGVGRLHWIYVIKGLGWFFLLAFGGWIANGFIMRGIMAISEGRYAMATSLMSINNGALVLVMGVGLLIFFFNVIKLISTEIGLSNRRIIHKTGLFFVKVESIDLEEIRGENLDTGVFGRLLNYAYVELDCRFIGDVKMEAMEKPDLFMRHLHKARAETQDSLRMVMGKGNLEKPIELVAGGDQDKPTPEIEPPKPTQPEVTPPNPPQEIPAQPEPPAIDPPAPTQPPTKADESISKQDVVDIVQKFMPQMTKEVVKEMAEQGLIQQTSGPDEKTVDTDLSQSFDEARIANENGDGHELQHKVEHVVH
jgi:hypothetical protein